MRLLFSSSLLLVARPLLAAAAQLPFTSLTARSDGNSSQTPMPMFQLSSDEEFAFILEEYLSLAHGGGASTGEVLRAAAQIKPGDFESWYKEWTYLADKIYSIAAKVDSKKNPFSARSAYFRAASYYRAADFFLHHDQNDKRIYTGWEKSLNAWDKGNALMENPGKRVTLKAKGFNVPAIVWSATGAKGGYDNRRPTVVACNGFDGGQEALWHAMGVEIVARGYNFVTFEGPGQPTPRRTQGLGFVPNWWDAVTPIIDYLYKQPYVDTKRIALTGVSFGGILAPLAASREHRLAAVLAIDGLYSLFDASFEKYPPQLQALYKSHNATLFDQVIASAYSAPDATTVMKWFFDQGMFAFNTKSPYDMLQKLEAINLGGGVLEKVKCPVFVGSGQNDLSMSGQAEKVAKELGDRATYHLFETDLGAGEHCQLGAEAQLAQVTMDWLGEVFEKVK